MITEDQIEAVLHSVANDHDTTKAVRGLLSRAWEEGWAEGWNAAVDHLSHRAVSGPNPYLKESS